MNYWVCPECSRKISTNIKACPHCKPNGQEPASAQPIPATQPSLIPGEPVIEVTSKYTAMNIISIAIKVLAGLILLAGVAGMFEDIPQKVKMIGLAGSVVLAILIWAYSEAIDIAIDIESNQRKMIKILSER